MMALCLAREEAVEEWRKLLGPTEIETAKQEAPESYVWQLHQISLPNFYFQYTCLTQVCTQAC